MASAKHWGGIGVALEDIGEVLRAEFKNSSDRWAMCNVLGYAMSKSQAS